jgi:hypothetical protein
MIAILVVLPVVLFVLIFLKPDMSKANNYHSARKLTKSAMRRLR